MLFDDKEQYSIPIDEKASLVSIVSPSFEFHKSKKETNASLVELRELLKTLGIEAGKEYIQNKQKIEAATILGKGKLQEIAQAAKEEGSSYLVFDFELTASQVRNIKRITELNIIDRNSVILEIFAKHARTHEAKIQIEISRLDYLLPRLSSLWTHLGRQRGGVGVKGGEGEQQIELDRRIIRSRISSLKKQLIGINKSREQQRKKRQNQAITAALVGYTNAGKSSLMNRMCKVDVLEEDKLFATLDSTFRMLNPDTKPPMILIDTVGFISNLPNTLITGFKTTLESALEADLLILVVDISDPNYQKHIEVTNGVLKELGLEEKEKMIVFNKKDLLDNPFQPAIALRAYEDSFMISSFDQDDVNSLKFSVIDFFLKKQKQIDLFVPYEDGETQSIISSKTNIITTSHHKHGIYYKIRVPDFLFNSLNLKKFQLAPDDPRIIS